MRRPITPRSATQMVALNHEMAEMGVEEARNEE